jgi:hypothetical protein
MWRPIRCHWSSHDEHATTTPVTRFGGERIALLAGAVRLWRQQRLEQRGGTGCSACAWRGGAIASAVTCTRTRTRTRTCACACACAHRR